MTYASQGAGARERRAPDAGGRREDGEARRRRGPGRDRRVSRGPRHRRVRALGLKPQSVHKVGGFRVQGREEAAAEQMLRDAKALRRRRRRHRAARMHSGGARRADHAGAARAGDRHRRGARHRRPDPRAVRRARHHAGSQAEILEEFPGRPRQRAGSGQGLRAGREDARRIPAPEHCF